MTKKLNNKKGEKKVNIIHRLSDTAVDQNERLIRQFQQAFGTSNSSRTFERTEEEIEKKTAATSKFSRGIFDWELRFLLVDKRCSKTVVNLRNIRKVIL